MDWIYTLELIGTLAFAISGVLTALDYKFDVVGSLVIGIVTAVGGGSIRDILIGETPVGWMQDSNYLYTIIIAVLLAHIFKTKIEKYRKGMFLFDTIGIALFAILGYEKTIELNLSMPMALTMGIVSAVFGGVLRDVLTNRVPLIFRQEIYATACLAGIVVYIFLDLFNDSVTINRVVAMAVVVIIRLLAVKLDWSLNFSEKK